jgi:chromosome segregation ATPase
LDNKNKYEQRLRQAQEDNLKLKNEGGIMRKKFISQSKVIEDHKAEIAKLQAEIQKLNGVIKSLDKDITGLKKEINERDTTIQDKEKRIYDLKKKNQELEKFKFVLDYKIKELKKLIEPRETEIKENKEQIQQMESELERISKTNQVLDLNIVQLKQKLKATEKEMQAERLAVREKEQHIRKFQTDLHNTVGLIQEPKQLKDSIKELYKKYTAGDTKEAASVDADIQKEYSRQREHLERSVASLRKKLSKDTEIHRADNVRIMQENVTLIKEINDLRRELKISRTKIHDYEAQLGVNKNKPGNLPDVARDAGAKGRSLSAAHVGAGTEEDQANRIIDMQREEIGKLRSQMNELEEQMTMRPQSGRLPPVD